MSMQRQKQEIAVHRPTGTDGAADASLRLIFDPPGNVAEQCPHHDSANGAACSLDHKYRMLFNCVHDGIIVMERRFIVDCNQRTMELFKGTADQIIGRCPSELSPEIQPDGRHSMEKAAELVEAALAGEPQIFEWQHRCLDGTLIDTEVSLSRYDQEDGEYLLAIVRDQSERKSVERSLTEVQALLEASFEQSPAGIVIADAPDVTIRFANQTALDIQGGTSEHLTGIDCSLHTERWQVFHPDGSPCESESMPLSLAVLKGQTTRNVEFKLKRTDGEWRSIMVNAAPIHNADGDVEAGVAVFTDITDRKVAEERLRQYARTDSLTGLPNRSVLLERLDRAIFQNLKDSEHRFAVLFLDIDDFKIVNDSLGHHAGDQLLFEFATRLCKCVTDQCHLKGIERPRDSVVRISGDEFAIVLEPIGDLGEAVELAERVLQMTHKPFNIKGHEFYSSTSIGIITSDLSSDDPDAILRDADTAMYKAKEGGKAGFRVFDRQMREQAMARLVLEQDLRQAIGTDQLTLHYQPIISLEDRELVAFEALVRWQHPRMATISPMEFIPLAEETGLIVPLGQNLLQQACRQIAQWKSRHPDRTLPTVCVNLSRRQLVQPDLLTMMERTLGEHGVEPGQIELEITESVIMDNVKEVLPVLNGLREMGFKLAMDDFGTGHSSMSCLHEFPVDTLKIDRSFTAHMDANLEYAAIIQALVTLAHNLDIRVIAEGVETAEQIAQLQALECDLVQGFHFARPMPADQAYSWMCGHWES